MTGLLDSERVAPPILPPQDGYLLLDKAKFAAAFAGDVSSDKAAKAATVTHAATSRTIPEQSAAGDLVN